jgi:hypothetical protein
VVSLRWMQCKVHQCDCNIEIPRRDVKMNFCFVLHIQIHLSCLLAEPETGESCHHVLIRWPVSLFWA